MSECVDERAKTRWDGANQALQHLTGQAVRIHDDETLSSPLDPLGELWLSPFRAAQPGYLLRLQLPLGALTHPADEQRVLLALQQAMRDSGRLQLLLARDAEDWAQASVHLRALVGLDAEPDTAAWLGSLHALLGHVQEVLGRLSDDLTRTDTTGQA